MEKILLILQNSKKFRRAASLYLVVYTILFRLRRFDSHKKTRVLQIQQFVFVFQFNFAKILWYLKISH